MSNDLATIIIVGACILAVAVIVAAAGYEGQRRGYNTPRGVGAIAAAVIVVGLIIWAVWARFDGDTADALTPAGTAGTVDPAGHPTLGVASRGDAPAAVN